MENLSTILLEDETVRDFYSNRSRTYSSRSEFECECDEGRCCKQRNFSIQVTIFDIIAASIALGKKPEEVFRQYLRLGIRTESETGDPLIRDLGIFIKDPCSFLENDLCKLHEDETGIYNWKPINCAIYPETHILTISRGCGNVIEWEEYRAFPCIAKYEVEFKHGKIPEKPFLSREREEIVSYLNSAYLAERAVTDLITRQHSPARIDFSPYQQKINESIAEICTEQGMTRDEYMEEQGKKLLRSTDSRRAIKRQELEDFQKVNGRKGEVIHLTREIMELTLEKIMGPGTDSYEQIANAISCLDNPRAVIGAIDMSARMFDLFISTPGTANRKFDSNIQMIKKQLGVE